MEIASFECIITKIIMIEHNLNFRKWIFDRKCDRKWFRFNQTTLFSSEFELQPFAKDTHFVCAQNLKNGEPIFDCILAISLKSLQKILNLRKRIFSKLANLCWTATHLQITGCKEKKDDETLNLGIGSQVKHNLVVSGLNNNDKSFLC